MDLRTLDHRQDVARAKNLRYRIGHPRVCLATLGFKASSRWENIVIVIVESFSNIIGIYNCKSVFRVIIIRLEIWFELVERERRGVELVPPSAEYRSLPASGKYVICFVIICQIECARACV